MELKGQDVRECPTCGKKFILPPDNAYKLYSKAGVSHFCTYSCWRKAGGGKRVPPKKFKD